MFMFKKEDKMNRLEELKQKAINTINKYEEVTKEIRSELLPIKEEVNKLQKEKSYWYDEGDKLEIFKLTLQLKPLGERQDTLTKQLELVKSENGLTNQHFLELEKEIREAYKVRIDEEILEIVKLREQFLESCSKVKDLYDEGNKYINSLNVLHNTYSRGIFERCHTDNFGKVMNDFNSLNKKVKFDAPKKKGIF